MMWNGSKDLTRENDILAECISEIDQGTLSEKTSGHSERSQGREWLPTQVIVKEKSKTSYLII